MSEKRLKTTLPRPADESVGMRCGKGFEDVVGV